MLLISPQKSPAQEEKVNSGETKKGGRVNDKVNGGGSTGCLLQSSRVRRVIPHRGGGSGCDRIIRKRCKIFW